MDTIIEPKHNARIYALAYGLWLLSTILGALSFFAGREMIVRTYLRFFPWDAWLFQLGQGSLSLVNIVITMAMAMLMIAIIIGGFEFQHHHMGKPQAWQTLARTLSFEIGILLLALFI